jgi:hypothetical protein
MAYLPAFTSNRDELTAGNRMVADFWLAQFFEHRSKLSDSELATPPVRGEGTFWNFLDKACGLILWERSAVARSTTYETVFFHRFHVSLAGESQASKDLVALVPEGMTFPYVKVFILIAIGLGRNCII